MSEICTLCKSKEANQTGSHIFTHALVSECVNLQGIKGRDKEIMFGISQSGDTDVYFGREVSVNKIEEIKGESLSEEEISQNKNAIVKDNIFCTDCEKLFSKVEGAFSITLKHIRNDNKLIFDEPTSIRLFFIIQAWRASACKFNGWKLPPDFEEHLRVLILNACTHLESGISKETINELQAIPIIVTYLETKSGNESTNVVLIPDNKNPYLLLLCDFIIQLYKPLVEITKLTTCTFLNLNESENHKPVNHKEEKFKFGFMNNSERVSFVERIHSEIIAGPALQGYIDKFVSYCYAYGGEPNSDLVNKFVNLLVSEDVPIASRYSDKRISELAQRMLKNR